MRAIQDYEGALETYEAALDIFTSTKNTRAQGNMQNNIGIAYCTWALSEVSSAVPKLWINLPDRDLRPAFRAQDVDDAEERADLFGKAEKSFREGVALAKNHAKDDNAASQSAVVTRLLALGRMLLKERNQEKLKKAGQHCAGEALEWARK